MFTIKKYEYDAYTQNTHDTLHRYQRCAIYVDKAVMMYTSHTRVVSLLIGSAGSHLRGITCLYFKRLSNTILLREYNNSIKKDKKLTVIKPKLMRGITRSRTTVITQKALPSKLMSLALIIVVPFDCLSSIPLVS